MLLKSYLEDGACHQAQAVLAFVKGLCHIDGSWDSETKTEKARIEVARWENCREQGYVLSLLSEGYKRQLNIAFFEHRNSDNICAVKWEQVSMNSLTIETAKFGDVYKDKYDVSYGVGYGEVLKMSRWIIQELNKFWSETSKEYVK